ncbi:cupin domain-containing protein [Almyronema epifaneia]|uniref:Cupin domain-containing protein n=1 Tax=Almyronema epifaneia S1 TaxID=2991925 RepID=A0ABW6IIV9_9CYAN
MNNLFQLAGSLPEAECFEPLARGEKVLIERIVSSGQQTPAGQWYDQPQAEWVVLLQGQAVVTYEDGDRYTLNPGDYLLIPAHCRHRVDYTSQQPPCIWLAIHADLCLAQ